VPVSPTGPTPAVVTPPARGTGFRTSVVDGSSRTGADDDQVGVSAGEIVRRPTRCRQGQGRSPPRSAPGEHFPTTTSSSGDHSGRDDDRGSACCRHSARTRCRRRSRRTRSSASDDVVAADWTQAGSGTMPATRGAIRRMGDPVQAAARGRRRRAQLGQGRASRARRQDAVACGRGAHVRPTASTPAFRDDELRVADDDAVGFRTAARDLGLDVTVTDPGSTPSTSGSVRVRCGRGEGGRRQEVALASPTPPGIRAVRERARYDRVVSSEGPAAAEVARVRPDAVDDAERVPTAARGEASWRFSANVNPASTGGRSRGLPKRALDDATRYPDDDYSAFRDAGRGVRPREPRRSAWGRRLIAYRRRVDLRDPARDGDDARRGRPRTRSGPSFGGEYAREVDLQGASTTFVAHDDLLSVETGTATTDDVVTSATIACGLQPEQSDRGDARRRGAPRFAARCQDAGTTCSSTGRSSGFTDEPSMAGRTGGRRPVAHEAVQVARGCARVRAVATGQERSDWRRRDNGNLGGQPRR